MKRAFGLTLLGTIFVVSGGVFLLIIIIEIVDYLSRYGWESIAIANLISLEGFLRHLVLPVLLYNTGVGMLLLQPWARRVAVYVLPFFFIFILADKNTLIMWIFIICALVYYLTRPEIKKQFGNVVVLG